MPKACAESGNPKPFLGSTVSTHPRYEMITRCVNTHENVHPEDRDLADFVLSGAW